MYTFEEFNKFKINDGSTSENCQDRKTEFDTWKPSRTEAETVWRFSESVELIFDIFNLCCTNDD